MALMSIQKCGGARSALKLAKCGWSIDVCGAALRRLKQLSHCSIARTQLPFAMTRTPDKSTTVLDHCFAYLQSTFTLDFNLGYCSARRMFLVDR